MTARYTFVSNELQRYVMSFQSAFAEKAVVSLTIVVRKEFLILRMEYNQSKYSLLNKILLYMQINCWVIFKVASRPVG